jgi:mannose-6-phosphate isomerase-like protein (cupin superfamily)
VSASALIVPGGGTDVGGGMVRKVLSAQTHGGLCVAEAVVPPGMLVPLHTHRHEDELTRVLEGVIHCVVGDERFAAPAGAYVLKPRGVPHSFWNEGPAPARVIELITPGTMDSYFAELFTLAARSDLDEAERRAAIDEHQRRYGLTFAAF